MFCHSCGSQVSTDVQFCPTCGQPLTPQAPVPAPQYVAPAGITASPGRWIGAGWRIVQADLGNIVLVGLVFMLLSGVPFLQGALLAGFHFYFLKRLLGRT